MSSLLVISPVRNEADHIERVARAVAAQTRRPDRWIVVDDGSDDGTAAILDGLCREIPFLELIRGSDEEQAADRLAAGRAARGFNRGLACARDESFDYIGKLDGDVELPRDYYEQLISRFEDDPALGIACGDLAEPSEDGPRRIRIPPHHVHGALKLYTRACFEAIGGVQDRLGWDTIDETSARMRGFATRSFRDVVALHHRPWGSAGGRLRGRARHGECAYIAYFSPWWVLLRSFKLATVDPYGVGGAAFLFGYVRAAARSVPRVRDREFRRFVRQEHRGRLRTALSAWSPVAAGRATARGRRRRSRRLARG